MKKLLLYFFTIKDLKIEQILFRLYYKFFHSYLKNKALSHLNVTVPAKADLPTLKLHFIYEKYSIYEKGKFNILNIESSLKDSNQWNNKLMPKLWLYNLHYMSYLLSQKHLTENPETALELIDRWIQENPKASGNGWEPYTLSLRIVNWIKFDLFTGRLGEKEKYSIFQQSIYLSYFLEKHLLGNHYFENLKTLLISGLYFNKEKAGKKFYEPALSEFNRQLEIQILSDGAHFELSPMYHAIILEGMLDLINIHRTYQTSYPRTWDEKTQRMIRYLAGMIHPDKRISFFSDSTFKVSKDPSEILGYASNLGFQTDFSAEKNMAFENAGYYKFSNHHFFFIIDAGGVSPTYLPGHAHADNLSFEISIMKRRFFVNSGISTYETNELRNLQRKTKLHNTVELNGKDQSEVWGAFRVARKAVCCDVKIKYLPEKIEFSAKHDKVKSFFKKPIHQRKVQIFEKAINIKDSFLYGENGNAISYFYLHPEVSITVENNLIILKRDDVTASFESSSENVEIFDSKFYPEYNKEVPNKAIMIKSKMNTKNELNIVISLLS